MSTSLDALSIRGRLGRKWWLAPEPFGPDGWRYASRDTIPDRGGGVIPKQSIVLSMVDAPLPGLRPGEWVHASIANSAGPIPSYGDLTMLHKAVWGAGYAYQVFAPPSEHINIHPWALHLWGRLDGEPALPDFGALGSI